MNDKIFLFFIVFALLIFPHSTQAQQKEFLKQSKKIEQGKNTASNHLRVKEADRMRLKTTSANYLLLPDHSRVSDSSLLPLSNRTNASGKLGAEANSKCRKDPLCKTKAPSKGRVTQSGNSAVSRYSPRIAPLLPEKKHSQRVKSTTRPTKADLLAPFAAL